MRRLLVLLALAGCAHAPRLPPGQAAGLEVWLTVPERGNVRVHLRVPAAALPPEPERVALVFPDLPRDYPSRLPGLPASRLVSPDADLTLDYEVPVLPLGARRPWSAVYGCFQGLAGRQLPLSAVVPRMVTRQGPLVLGPATLDVEAPQPVLSSLTGEGGAYLAGSSEDLRRGLVLVGPAREVVAADGLRLVSFDLDREALLGVAALEARAAAALERRFGPRSPLALVALHRRPPGPQGPRALGVNSRRTATVILEGALDGRATSWDGSVLLHELVHSSLPSDAEVPTWMEEGVVEYVTREVGLELDRLPEEALREQLAGTWEAFVESTPSRRPADTAIGDYYGGAVLAHCVDLRLRRSASSLDAVLRVARARAGGDLTNAFWEEELARASPAAAALVERARAHPLDPVEACFREVGYRRRPPVPGVKLAYLRAELGVAAVDAAPRHLDVVAEAVDRGPFQPGDALVEVNGRRVLGLDHLRELLAGPQPSPCPVRISRGGQALTVPVYLSVPGPEDLEPVERQLWLKP